MNYNNFPEYKKGRLIVQSRFTKGYDLWQLNNNFVLKICIETRQCASRVDRSVALPFLCIRKIVFTLYALMALAGQAFTTFGRNYCTNVWKQKSLSLKVLLFCDAYFLKDYINIWPFRLIFVPKFMHRYLYKISSLLYKLIKQFGSSSWIIVLWCHINFPIVGSLLILIGILQILLLVWKGGNVANF